MHPEFPPIAIVAALSLLLPLPWHWRAGNIATLSMIFWLFISNIIYAVDALIWSNNVARVAPVWCDITTKIIIGANFALPAACLCLCIHLEQVASVRLASTTIHDKRRRQYFEAGMCFGLPMLFMVLHTIVQGHRFDIIEDYGCRPTTYFSIPSIFIVWIPPILMAIGSLIFAAIALRHFVIRRLTFGADLLKKNSGLTTSRYLRLISMASLQMIWSLAITCYTLWFTVLALPIRPWTTWTDVHSDFSRVDAFPSLFTPPLILHTYYVLWWMVPISTFTLVGFFSFGQDAIEEYQKCFSWIRARIFRMRPSRNDGKKQFMLPFNQSPPPQSLLTINISNVSTSSTHKILRPPFMSSVDTHDTLHDTDSLADTQVGIPMYLQCKALGSVSDLSPSSSTTFPESSTFTSSTLAPSYTKDDPQWSPRPTSSSSDANNHSP